MLEGEEAAVLGRGAQHMCSKMEPRAVPVCIGETPFFSTSSPYSYGSCGFLHLHKQTALNYNGVT